MGRVLVLVEPSHLQSARPKSLSLALQQFQKAIRFVDPNFEIELVSTDSPAPVEAIAPSDLYLCPLTLSLEAYSDMPKLSVYRVCAQITDIRRRVEQMGYATGEGNYWLPIVLTLKGPLYGEAIGCSNSTAIAKLADWPDAEIFSQPVHLPDAVRQPLYHVGYRLLCQLGAPPSVYLLQFGMQHDAIVIDRLFPFPAPPAVASLSSQTPDLFTCHWYCQFKYPIRDLVTR